jgi:succinate dehydrogenase / fumarate reductase membrane anchor subunit
MRTELKKARGLGSAKEGTDHFWKQRLTALSNIPLILFFIILITGLTGKDYQEALSIMQSPFVLVTFALVILSVCVHMKIGMQVIIEDYVHEDPGRILLLAANQFFPIVIAALSFYALFSISFGG